MRRDFTHEIRVPLPVEKAFLLFTPKGEEGWVPGWSPDYVFPDTGETIKDMIFCTGRGEEATIWTCLDWQPDRHHVRYLRTTPALRTAFVEVNCHTEGSGTKVVVSYGYIPLTAKGRETVMAMTQQAFAAGIDEWSLLIADHLQAGTSFHPAKR